MARLAQAYTHWMARLFAQFFSRLFDGVRDRPARFGYVLMALFACVVVFSLSDYLPAPYDMRH